MTTQNVMLNGASSFSAFDDSYSWNNRWLGNVGMGVRVGGTGSNDAINTLNVSLTGAPWSIKVLSLENDVNHTMNTSIVDAHDGISRRIDRIQLQDNGVASITLFDTHVRYIEGGAGGTVNLTLGTKGTNQVSLWQTDNTVNLGTGAVDSMFLGDGINVVNGGAGWLHALQMGNGNNTFNGGSGGFGSIRAFGNVNHMTFANGGDSLVLGDGNNFVTLNAASINSLVAKGNDTISLRGDARVLLLKMDEGVNHLTSEDGNIESIYAYHAESTILLGAGGAQQIVLSGSAAAQVIHSDGWLGSLQVYAGNQINVESTTVVLGDGGGGYIQTSKGNDQITTGSGSVDSINTYDGNDKVTIGSGGVHSIQTGDGKDIVNLVNSFVDYVATGDGNDVLLLGSGGARFVALGAGDDKISLVAIPADFGIVIDGDEGNDTVDLSRFTQGLTVSLNQGGNFQDFGVSGAGFYLLHDMENLTGTARADKVTGSDGDNRLLGGRGADTLSGLGGNDTLNGGRGNDRLIGGDGADTFVFLPGDGTDRITRFTLGADHIQIGGVHQLSAIGFVQVGADVQLNVGANLHILVQNTVLADLHDAANFLF